MKRILLLLTVILMSCTTLLQAQVCNKPTINSFSPVTGFIGSVVTINGSNFDPIPANNQVFFGSTQAQVLSATFGVLEVRVPVGATYGPITVRNACGLIGASPLSFNGIFCGTTINTNTYNTVSYTANVSGGYQMISQDIDLDGKPDLLVCGFTANRVSVMRNLSTPGTFNFASKFDLVFQGATRCISTGDFDGDGKIDIAVVDNGINGIRIYRNTSVPGTLSFATPIDVSASGSYQLATGDINGDGKMDLVYGSGSNIGALRNTSTTGSISFAAAQIFNNTYYLTGVAIADVDGDGRPDVGTSCPGDNLVTGLRNTTTPGSATFSFAPAVSFPTNSSYPYRLFLGDFDKDNKIDFVTNNFNGATTSVFRNTSVPGTISFAPTVNLSSPTSNYRLGVGDADGDGNVDLVTKSSGENLFSVYKNTSSGQGNISFAPRVDYPGQAEVSGILIGDLDGDYVPDIATSGISYNTLRVHRNNSTVVDNTAPTASCKNITVALSPAGTVTITPQMVDNGSSDACGIQSLALSKTNFTCADIGANNVTLTVTDRAGNVSTCTAVVTVAPAAVIIAGQSTVCQGQTVTMSANPGDSYQWQKDGVDIPGATNQNYVASVTGNYSVTVTNAGGCSGTSSAVPVTVSPAPVVTTTPSGNATLCNGSLVITASAGSVYQWSNGATTQAITVTQAGSYSVTVTNQFGCTNTSAPVVVGATDNVPPVAKCKNITVAIGANGTASITAASVNDGSTDNCSAVTLSIAGQTSYSCADAGNTFNVVLTVRDAQGNQSNCTATVTITDPNSYCNQPPVAVCKPLTVSANANCQGIAAAIDFNNGSSDPNGDALTYSVFPAGPYAKGITNVVLTVTDSKGASSTCATTITVVDNTAPVVTAPANVTVNTDAGLCIATNVNLGTPTVTDNCTGWTVTNNASTQFEKGVTNITWTVTDASGNVTTAVQTVTVKDVTPPVIICQPNVAVNNDPNKCGAVVNYAVNATDNCVGPSGTLTFAYTGSIINWTVPAGVTKINIKALGGRGGNSINGFGGGGNGGKGASIQGDFTVVPGQVLKILVAGHGEDAINSQNILNTGGGGGSFVWNSTSGNTLMLAAGGGTGLGTCNSQQAKPGLATLGGSGNGGLGGNFNCGINNGGGGGAGWLSNGGGTTANPNMGGRSPLNGGTAGVAGSAAGGYFGTAGGFGGGAGGGGNCGGPGGGGGYTGGNGGDNTLCGAGTQQVSGGTSYNIGTNQVNSTGVNDGHGQVIISYQGSSATVTQTAGLPSGSLFPVGTTTNTFVATDESGNTSTCSFDVVVTDVQKPVITNIPANITVSNDAAVCGAKVNWTAPVATDNCPGVVLTSSHQSGDLFPIGNTTVTYTATDAYGNTISSAFTVTVNDTEKPVINGLPANITVSNDAGVCGANVNWAVVTASDNCAGATIVSSHASGQQFPIGTTTVTYTATDAAGNSSTASFTVTVNDTEKPVIHGLPANITVSNDAGVCGANVSWTAATATDNCAGVSIVSSYAPGHQFPVGTTTVTYTATDAAGNTASGSFIVTVNDTEKPVIAGMPSNAAVSNDAGICGAKVIWTAPSAADNCPGVVLTSTHQPGFVFPVGTTTVTYTATDAYGNTTSASFTVTVADTEKPTITAPAAIQVSNDAGQCAAAVSLGNAVTGDNCGVQSVVNNAPATFPVGTTTVIWTVTDIHGNVSTATQTVTVNDTEKPVIACAANQVFCANTGGNNNYAIPVLTQSDNCGIASTTYTVSGATNRSGNGTNASGVFAIGTSTVTYTVTDIHGNVSTCSFTVTINPLPVPSVQAASPNVFCSEFTLTGSGNQNGPFVYNWSLNGNAVGATQVLTLGLTNPDGLYKLTITDANGCTSEFPATYQYNKQNLTNSYTILAYKEVKLGAYNEVQTGSVGVMSSKGEADFKKYSKVNGAGSFVKAPEIDKDKGVTILSQVNGVATVSLPTMQYNTSVTKYLPNYTVGTNTTVTLNGNFRDLNIRKGANVTLNGTIFGSIKVEEGASIRFTSSVVNIEELRVDKGSRTTMSYVRFAQATSVRVSKNVSIGNDVIVNPDYHSVTFFMGDLKCDEEKFYVKGDDTKVIANVYMPNGKLKVRGGNGNDHDDDRCDHKAHSSKYCKHNNNKHGHKDCNHNGHSEKDCEDNVHMIGLFIAEEVESEGKNVIWNNFSCSVPAPVVAIASTTTSANLTQETVKQPARDEATQLQVTVMPNPSATVFTLKLQSKNNAPVQLRITDATGRAVENRANLGANSTVQVGAGFVSGTYYAEFTQGNQRKVVQLIKVRR